MKRIYIYIYLSFSLIGKTQNLVPNSGFETYTLCPNTASQIESAIPWNAATTTSSTDYYNSCSSTYNVPNTATAFQFANTGNAFAGLFISGAISSDLNKREYLQIRLTSILLQNKTYYVEFFVNLHDGSWSSGCNNIAANFSINRPFSNNFGDILLLTPHIVNPGNPIISDRVNWVQVSGCYTALGGEEYLTIGNFFDNNNTQFSGSTGSSYYFIDDVRVEEMISVCVTGLNELSAAYNLNLYPNPTIGNLKITITNISNREQLIVKLVDVIGREVLNESYKEEIDISGLEKGVYFVSVYKSNQSLETRKVVKE